MLVGNAEAQGFSLYGMCGFPFTFKSLGAHARFCSGPRPSRPLEPLASCLLGIDNEDSGAGGGSGTPSTVGRVDNSRRLAGGSVEPSLGFLALLIAVGGRSIMLSPATIP